MYRVLRNSSLRLNSSEEATQLSSSSSSSSTSSTSDLNPEAYYQLSSKAQDPGVVFHRSAPQVCDNQSLLSDLKDSGDVEKRETITMERNKKISIGGSGGGITERLAALKRSGEEDWKKKVPKLNPEKASPVLDILNSNRVLTKQSCDKENNSQLHASNTSSISSSSHNLNNKTGTSGGFLQERVSQLKKASNFDAPSKTIAIIEDYDDAAKDVVLRGKRRTEPNKRPVSIVSDRLSKLEISGQSWQNRIGEKDVGKYTVAGKMQSDQRSKSTVESPNLLHVTPETRAVSVSPKTPRRTPNEDLDRLHVDRVKQTPKLRTYTGNQVDLSQIKPNSRSLIKPELTLVTHEELKSDQGLDSFFSSLRLSSISMVESQASPSPMAEPAEEFDFDSIVTVETSRLSMPKRISRAQPHRRTTRNPVKSLSERTDIKILTFSHMEEPGEVLAPASPEVTLRRDHNRASTNSKHAHLAEEAIAGLAATEDFSAVQLRKSSKLDENQSKFIPYKSPMLMQVKGRRCCQTRLVKPVADSINSGDAFVLVTNKQIFNWQGRYANVIEKSRSAEISATILKKGDLGCKRADRIYTLEEEKLFGSSKAEREFWSILGVSEDRLEKEEPLAKPAGPASEDEEFELAINDLNLVWEVAIHNGVEELIPCEKAWGCMPKHELLDPGKVLVIDFGPEAYTWNGSNAGSELRKAGLNLLKQVWDSGFDFSGADCSHPLLDHQVHGTRPDWGVMGKIIPNMETILFKEKFLDWPDQAKISRVKQSEIKLAKAIDNNLLGEIDVSPYDAETMNNWIVEDPNLELENCFLGRGRGYYDQSERRQYELETLSVQVHHVNEYNITELPEDWSGQFHSEDTYVVRWIYKVSLTGRDLKGRPSKHAAVGRERCAYFFWQGADSKTTEKGASALMTVEMDREEGPQLRVDHGKEHAAFLNMWNGSMVIYRGKRANRLSRQQPEKSPWRLFMLRGECPEESCLEEVGVGCANLRSIGSFVLVNVEQCEIFVWQGISSPDHKQAMAVQAAERLKAVLPDEMGFQSKRVTLHIETEGQESGTVKSALGLPSKMYLKNLPGPSHTPRLFHMSSVATGRFDVTEIVCPFHNVKVLNTMPFSQNDLYSSDQPALFLLDVGNKLWLWQGFWPEVPDDPNYEANEDNPNSQNNNITGSGMIRWHAERRAAMQTAVEYRRLRYGLGSRAPKAELVWAGWEPLEFTNLFPIWIDQPDATRLNEEFVKHADLEMTLEALSKTEYSWEELQQRPLPDGVDPAKLERYLSEDEFQSHFGFTKKDFMTFPRWKQTSIRKEKGLF
eukprot:TCALIF_08869-PA protein Name:"Similar to SVIL Supervillin (Bos taurus)" AED:0.01 eAED:0.01 QI:0/0.8/0.66/0.83/1/1/6/288/1304